MCGIAGICYKRIDPIKNIKAMNEAMIHRGPDAGGHYLEESMKVVLGHRRLAILDLTEAGAQPMVSKDERYVIVYNGEIYNCPELHEKLIADGHSITLRGSSDTELLLESIIHYGLERTLQYVKGMFAIALLDREEKKLFLARDRMGEKPLYYGKVAGDFVFASDLNAIKGLEGFSNPISNKVLPLYFKHGYVPAPYTIYEGIYKLEPGTILETKQPYKKHTIVTYWDIAQLAKKGEQNPFKGSEKEARQELERLLKESIQGQMVADVPLGAFLSGGIDSTLVVALMQSMSKRKVKTFTIGMKEKGYNEANIAKQTSKHIGTKHEELYVGHKEVMEILPEIPFAYGEPFADSSQIPTMLVSKMTSKHVTVSLSGDAGDELFGGYNSYLGAQDGLAVLQSKAGFLPTPIRTTLGTLCKVGPTKQFPVLEKAGTVLTTNTLEDYKRATHTTEYQSQYLGKKSCGKLKTEYSKYKSGYLQEPIHNLMLMDQIQYLPDDILTKVDRAGMYYSLETRIPMLDRDVISFAWSLPLSYTFDQKITKKILRELLYQYVPKKMIDRPKKGFSIPVGQWLLNGKMTEWAESVMLDSQIYNYDIIDQKVAMQMWNQFKKDGKYTPAIWYLLMFQQWALSQ